MPDPCLERVNQMIVFEPTLGKIKYEMLYFRIFQMMGCIFDFKIHMDSSVVSLDCHVLDARRRSH